MDKENLATMEFCIAVKNGMVTFQVNGRTGRYDPESVDSGSERNHCMFSVFVNPSSRIPGVGILHGVTTEIK